ncbi:MAG: glycosyltransferase [Candidatus Eisenbacteria bacterium]|nr:glycosyltransferase [Candidatus Eisenbacteria bacterium]
MPDGTLRTLANVWKATALARDHEAPLLLWSPREGILSALLGMVWTSRRVPTVAINLIAFPQPGLRGRVRDRLFRAAFVRSDLTVTVNSEWLRRSYIALFGIEPQRIHALPDCWLPKWLLDKSTPGGPDDGYVFAGGTAARDWTTLLRAAAYLPEIPFRVIASEADWPTRIAVPTNVEVFFDTPEDFFWETARRARMVVVCLSSRITSGLVVLILSAVIGRPVISTKTPATEPYYPKDSRNLLIEVGDHRALADRIRALWTDERLCTESASAIQKHILEEHTPQAFAHKIREIIDEVAAARTERGSK